MIFFPENDRKSDLWYHFGLAMRALELSMLAHPTTRTIGEKNWFPVAYFEGGASPCAERKVSPLSLEWLLAAG